jgi:hypothetical protein
LVIVGELQFVAGATKQPGVVLLPGKAVLGIPRVGPGAIAQEVAIAVVAELLVAGREPNVKAIKGCEVGAA